MYKEFQSLVPEVLQLLWILSFFTSSL